MVVFVFLRVLVRVNWGPFEFCEIRVSMLLGGSRNMLVRGHDGRGHDGCELIVVDGLLWTGPDGLGHTRSRHGGTKM